MTELRHDQKELTLEECDPRNNSEIAWDTLDETISWIKAHEEIETDFEEENWTELKQKAQEYKSEAVGMAKIISVFFVMFYPTHIDVLKEANRRWRAHNTEDLAHRTFGVNETPEGLKNWEKTPAGKRKNRVKLQNAVPLGDDEKQMIADMVPGGMMTAQEVADILSQPVDVVKAYLSTLS